jgi:hypothetical protein
MRVRFLVMFYGSYGMFAVTARVGSHRLGINSLNLKLQRSSFETDGRNRRLKLPELVGIREPINNMEHV